MSETPEHEHSPFLQDGETRFRFDKQNVYSHKPSSRMRVVVSTVVLTIAILSLATNIILLVCSEIPWQACATKSRDDTMGAYTPAKHFTDHEIRIIDTHEPHSPFYSPPGPDFDRAWSELLVPSVVKVSAEELRRANKQSLKLKGSDDYLGYIEVYHQLHCVKRLTQIRYPERYPELSERGHLSEGHFNHCIEVLRKGIMCNGDTTLNTYKWIQNGNDTQIFGVSDAPKKCINWELLDDWARTRAPEHDYELLGPEEAGHFGP